MDHQFSDKIIRFVQSRNTGVPGCYLYSAFCGAPTLYSSTYAAMIYSLLGREIEDRADWADYICSFQDDDGLFRDPVIYGQGWYEGDPLWCGRAHLSCHAIIALACLERTAPKKITFIDFWKDPDRLVRWLESRLWNNGGDISQTGNEIMNIGSLLQYSRDFHEDEKAGRALSVMLEWLCENHLNPETGLWGDDMDLSNPLQLSNSVQAAYHWWELFFYDGIEIPYADKAVETILKTQNPHGGFGLGVHNPDDPFVSSACEDIDSMAPLSRLYALGAVRSERIISALQKGMKWVESNQTSDGGMEFIKDKDFVYGHPQLTGKAGHGAMFPTWFRTLTLALASHALGDDSLHFVRCPGMQFDAVTVRQR